jgi:hypothetical protein
MDLTVLTSFVALMMAVSIAAERMVEVLKGWFPNSWLFKANTDPTQEARRCAWIHVLAGVCGVAVAAVGNIDIFQVIHIPSWTPTTGIEFALFRTASWSITGILASGGSAFWNHILDLIKATKVQQEQKAGI